MPRTIIICYDHSPSSRYAVQWAVSNKMFLPDDSVVLATALEEDVVAIEGGSLAIPNVVGGAGDFMLAEYTERVQKMEDDAERELKHAVETIRKHVGSVHAVLLRGEPKTSLVEYATNNRADLVIVGQRGLGWLKRKILGSVSDYLSHNLKTPILIVRDSN
ncbi:hypothetical protein NQZ79_g3914 [Umbelopsis isabellina]|nr:hypothetical protein NQZ79_g3914 [Umbelopsis isabellina]